VLAAARKSFDVRGLPVRVLSAGPLERTWNEAGYPPME
jgi:hypothetical protein